MLKNCSALYSNTTISVNFDNPDKLGWNSTALPLFSGKIVVSSSIGEQLSVPYMGKPS